MKCQAVLLLLAAATCGPLAADPAAEVREIRRLLEARGESLDARSLALLKSGRPADLAQLRRAIQHRPPPRAANIGQGMTGKKPAATRKLQPAARLR